MATIPSNDAARAASDMSEGADHGALNCEQQQCLRDWKIQTRIINEEYLRNHADLQLLLSGFIRDVLQKRPENIREFAADYFTDLRRQAKLQEKRSPQCLPPLSVRCRASFTSATVEDILTPL
ncbi:RIIa domain-containing protein 1 [Dendrobates tinctorius]|uniref:RIIa domain-containing protein 1 n=1 Tax=Dendrobates tinctorius TaxID=92724 RepID=UPI003CC9E15C